MLPVPMPPKGNAIIASWRPVYVRGYRMRSACATAAAVADGPCAKTGDGTPRSARPAAATSLRNVRRPLPDVSLISILSPPCRARHRRQAMLWPRRRGNEALHRARLPPSRQLPHYGFDDPLERRRLSLGPDV